MTIKQSRLTVEMVKGIIEKAICNTTAYKDGDYQVISHDIGLEYRQPITIAANQSRTKQMEMAYTIANQCATADEDYPMTKTSIQVDLVDTFKASIIIREY